jgi:peptide/nickel transport system substrate-binding protein
VRGGTLRVSFSQTATDLDPENIQSAGDVWDDQQIFGYLLAYKPGSESPIPDLASSYSVSGDGLTYTFHLRRGLRFSNGDPLTAQDVVFSLRRDANPAINVADPICCYTYKSVTASNAYTVILKLTRATPTVPDYLPGAGIIDAKYFTRVGQKYFMAHPIGSGPFMVKSFTPGGILRLARNPYYWRKGQPYLDGIIITPVADTNSRILSVTSGQADVADQIPYSQAVTLASGTGTRLVASPFAGSEYVFMNEQYGPLRETTVRRALSYATPRSAIVNAVFHRYATVSNSDSVAAGDYSPTIKQLPYSLANARKTLAQSSVPHGFSVQIQTVAGEPSSYLIATILQNSWAQLGVHASIHSLDNATFYSDWTSGKYQALVLPPTSFSSDIPQPDELLEGFVLPNTPFHGWFTWYDNPTATAIFKKALATPAEPAHRSLILKLQRLSITDPPVLAIAFPKLLTLVRSNVCNFDPSPEGYFPYRQVYPAAHC